MQAGDEVIFNDNYFTTRKANIEQYSAHPPCELIRRDVLNLSC
jgi:UDP-glucuronate decarboxylase